MKKITKIFSLVFLCLCVFTLVGCFGSNSEKVVAEAINNYLSEHSERAGSVVISNLTTDNGDSVILELETPSGDKYNLLVSIKGVSFNLGSNNYVFPVKGTYDIDYQFYDEFRDYILVNCRKKLTLDMELINSYLQ
jgi:hypothetical protein